MQTKAVLLTKPEPLLKLSNLPCKKCCLWVTPYDRLSPDSATSWSLAKGAEESMYTQGLIAWGFYDTSRIKSLSFKISHILLRIKANLSNEYRVSFFKPLLRGKTKTAMSEKRPVGFISCDCKVSEVTLHMRV